MEKRFFAILFLVFIFSSACNAQELKHFSNSNFDFNYSSNWEFIEPSNSNPISSDYALMFESEDRSSIAIVSMIDENEYASLGNINNAPDITVSKVEDSAALFGIPAKKYYFSTDIEGFFAKGEVTISEAKDGYFYKLMVIGDSQGYIPFEIASSNETGFGGNETQNGNDSGANNQQGNAPANSSSIIDLIFSFFAWLFGVIVSFFKMLLSLAGIK
jgi:hypothetical protein